MRNIKETYCLPRDQITPTKHGLPYWTRIVLRYDEIQLLTRQRLLIKSNWGIQKRIKKIDNRNFNPKYVNFFTYEMVIVDQSTKSSFSWSFVSLPKSIFFFCYPWNTFYVPVDMNYVFKIFTRFIAKSNSFLDFYRKIESVWFYVTK